MLVSLASSPRSLALARASLQSSPVLSSLRSLATSPAARFVCLACRLALLAASSAALASLVLRLLPACLAPVPCFARAMPSARFARRLACCSLRSPCLLLAPHCCACSAHRLASCSRFARRLTCDCSLRSPLCLRLLASLAVSPTRAAPPRSLRLPPAFLGLLLSDGHPD